MKKADFFIAGNSKSGTTALHAFLQQHPEICMSVPKEPNFFATDFCHDVDAGAFTRKSAAQYHSFYHDPTESKVWGEASACYLYSKAAAEEIYAYNPDAKIVAMLREPVSFLHSYHMQQLKNVPADGETVKDFRKALALEERRRQGDALPEACLVPELLYYSERVKYAEHLERFFRLFPASQIKVIVYEDFKADNAGVYREVLDFLGVDASFEPQLGKHNKGKKLRSKALQEFMTDLTHGRSVLGRIKPLVKRLLPQSLRRALVRTAYNKVIFKPKPDLDPDLAATLRAQFQGEVEKVSQLLGRDLAARWGYEPIRSVAPQPAGTHTLDAELRTHGRAA